MHMSNGEARKIQSLEDEVDALRKENTKLKIIINMQKLMTAMLDVHHAFQVWKYMKPSTVMVKIKALRIGINHYVNHNDSDQTKMYKCRLLLMKLNDMPKFLWRELANKFGDEFLYDFIDALESMDLGNSAGGVSDREIVESDNWWRE